MALQALVFVAQNSWIRFWREIATPEWAANVGLPTAIAVAAITLGVWALKRQLEHDREIARAVHRAEVARELGADVRQAALEWEEHHFSSEWFRQRDWPGWNKVWKAVGKAEIVFGHERLEPIYDRAREVTHLWRTAQRCRAKLGRLDEQGANDHGAAIEDLILHPTSRLARIGEELLRWDGHWPIPLPSGQEASEMPHPVSDKTRYKEWRLDASKRYNDFMRKRGHHVEK